MKLYVFAAALVVGGCSTAEHPLERTPYEWMFYGLGPEVKEFPGPDGRKGYTITCDTGSRAAECYQAAAKVCDGKYDVLARGDVNGGGALDVLCKAGVDPQ